MNSWDYIVIVLKAIWDFLVLHSTIIFATLLSIFLSTAKSLRDRNRLDWLEAVICGALTLSVSATLEYLNLPNAIAVFLGGFIGFKGSVWFDKYTNKRLDT